MKSLALDIEDPAGVKAFAAKVAADFPRLNAVVHNVGIARMEKLKEQNDVSDAEAMVATNVLGPIRLNSALLPHLGFMDANTAPPSQAESESATVFAHGSQQCTAHMTDRLAWVLGSDLAGFAELRAWLQNKAKQPEVTPA